MGMELRVGSRKLPPSRMANELEKAVVNEVQESIKKKLRTIRCPQHGEASRLASRGGHKLQGLNMRIEGCCEVLIERVKTSLEGSR